MGSGGGGGGGSDTQTNYIRYAPYVESRHQSFLTEVATRRSTIGRPGDSPYRSYSGPDLNLIFFGTGSTIGSFTALYRQYDVLFTDYDEDEAYRLLFDNTMSSSQTKDLIKAQRQALSDDLEAEALPRLMLGARDVNAMQGSTYIVAKAMLEEARLKEVNKFAADTRYKMINVAMDRWKIALTWRQQKFKQYQDLHKFYLASMFDFTSQEYGMKAKDVLWPFTVLEHERAALGALQGAKTNTHVAGDEGGGVAGALGGALSGAAAGAMIGGETLNPFAVAAGAVIGGIAGALG